MVTKRHLNGRKQTVSIRNFGHSITAPCTAPYFHSDTVTIRLFTYINGPYYCARKYGPYYCARKYGPYYCARKYGPYRSTWVANTYASTCNFTKAAELRLEIGQIGIKKRAGLSWTVVNEEIVVRMFSEWIKVISDHFVFSDFEPMIDLILNRKKFIKN